MAKIFPSVRKKNRFFKNKTKPKDLDWCHCAEKE
jgi:hypothetical protein